MSVTIRLARTGRKNLPSFRVVVANTRSKRNGVFIDILGFFNPSEKKEPFKLDAKKYTDWLGKGALVTDSVKELVDGKYEFVAYPSAKKVKREAAKAAQTKE